MIIVSPTDRWLKAALADCRRSFTVASPYVGGYLSKAVGSLEDRVAVTLLTRTLLTDFASRASDLESVISVANRAGSVLSLSSLHAKVYVLDVRALITSANATTSGMFRNRECGYEVKGRKQAAELRGYIAHGFGSTQRPQVWTVKELNELQEPVERLRAALPKTTRLQNAAIEAPPRMQLAKRDYSRLLEGFAGWLRLTLDGISRIGSATFTMDEVLASCAPLAAVEFPENKHVREKLRQQMPRLRDLGLVSFLGGGRYELLARAN